MPRGRSKQAYGNRTDLNGKIPKAAPTGMPYGENKKLMDAQSAVPMGNPEMETVAPQEQPSMAQAPMAQKVTPIPLTAPTQRPNENILTGATTTRQPDSDMQKLKSLQPLFEAEAATDDAPQVFREFVSWLKTQ
jgi:septal ring-binding cell division protein DamX